MAMAEPVTTEATSAPIILEVGKVSKRKLKRLLRGSGPLLQQITQSVDELKVKGTIAANAQPVIVVVKQKRKKSKAGGLLGF